jgi:parvulin-like peptidyl-prolyl isomerase
MFKFLRSQAKLFYWVIAATFILFLFLGGLTGRGCQAPGTRQYDAGVVGTVAGVEITGQQYDYAVRQQTAVLSQQSSGNELTANQYALARERAWDQLVRAAIAEKAIRDREIRASDAEVLDVFQNDPPAEVLAGYRTADGQIDVQRYFADLQNPDNDWSLAEQFVRETVIPQRKLYGEVTADAFVTDEAVREEFLRQTGRAVAEYVGVIYAELPNAGEPGEADVQAWYEAHADEYVQEPRYQSQVVRFAKEASERDWEEIEQYMLEIREEITSGEKEFADAAMEYSDDSNASRGGDLGSFDRNRMVAPFTEVAFELPLDEISQPVRTRFGYHLIKVTERDVDEDTGEVYQIRASHILLRVTPGPETIDLIREQAEQFRVRVDGESFVMTAEAEALDLLTPEPVAPGRDIPTLRQTLTGANWLGAAIPGDVSPVFENNDFLYVVRADAVLPGGTAPLEEVRGQIMLALRKESNLATARTMLSPAVGEFQMGTPLAETAATHGLTHAVTDTFTMNGNVPDVGYGTDFNRLAINGAVGEIVPEVETLRGLFALVPLWIAAVDEEGFAAAREGIRAALLNRAQSDLFEEWIAAEIAAAEVVDLRYRLGLGI